MDDCKAAGAPVAVQSRSRCRAELEGDRKMRGRAKDLNDMYDDYLDHSEDYTFGKLKATLGKLERKAEKEHKMFTGAAGWSTEHRNELADARSTPGGRRSRSPATFGRYEESRMSPGAGGGSSVASLMQQGNFVNGLEQEDLRSRRGCASPRQHRMPSPRRADQRMPSPRRAASPRMDRPNSSRPSSARDASPARQRPPWQN
jgi:hypothetical protein